MKKIASLFLILLSQMHPAWAEKVKAHLSCEGTFTVPQKGVGSTKASWTHTITERQGGIFVDGQKCVVTETDYFCTGPRIDIFINRVDLSSMKLTKEFLFVHNGHCRIVKRKL